MMMPSSTQPDTNRIKEIFASYATLGFISFGGPPAHMALLHNLFVEKKRWIDDSMYTELLGICQALPGPASTQLAFSIALCYGGILGGVVAFLLWSLPMMVVMTILAIVVSHLSTPFPPAIRHITNGLVSIAVGLVALAAFKLSQKTVTDRVTMLLCLFSACAATVFSGAWVDPCLMFFGGLVTFTYDNRERVAQFPVLQAVVQGWTAVRNWVSGLWGSLTQRNAEQLQDQAPYQRSSEVPAHVQSPPLRPVTSPETTSPPQAPWQPDTATVTLGSATQLPDESITSPTTTLAPVDISVGLHYSPKFGAFVLIGSMALFLLLVILKSTISSLPRPLSLLANLYIAGTIIFGGGPVVIPLLHSYVVGPGWITEREFLVGLAFVNVLPGPNFNFGPYCGALALRSPTIYALFGSLVGYFGIFFPGLALKLGLLPLWKHLRGKPVIKSVLRGVSASAVGLVYYAVYVIWLRAVSLPDGTSGPLDGHALYVVLAAVAFVTVGPMGLPAPLVVICGGVIGFCEYLFACQSC